MRTLLPKLLFYYCAIAAFFITISLVFTSQTLAPVVFATLFLPITAYFTIEFFKQMRSLFSPKPVEGSDLGSPPKKTEFITMTIIFLLLLGVGLKNIIGSTNKNISTDAGPTLVPTSTPLVFKSQETKPAEKITIEITDGSPTINIRQKPTVYSEKIGEAKDGDTFESLGLESGWYKIKYNDTEGYVSQKYAKEVVN